MNSEKLVVRSEKFEVVKGTDSPARLVDGFRGVLKVRGETIFAVTEAVRLTALHDPENRAAPCDLVEFMKKFPGVVVTLIEEGVKI